MFLVPSAPSEVHGYIAMQSAASSTACPVPSFAGQRRRQRDGLRSLPRRRLVGLAACAAGALLLAARAATAATMWPTGAITSKSTDLISIVGVVRGKYVVAYDPDLETVTLRANGTRINCIPNKDWRAQERRYGERSCFYAEFPMPAVPSEVVIAGFVDGIKIAEEKTWVTEAEVPAAAAWNDQYMRKGGIPRKRGMTLRGQKLDTPLLGKGADTDLAQLPGPRSDAEAA